MKTYSMGPANPPASPAELAARACGWDRKGDGPGIIYNRADFGSWKEAVSHGNEEGFGRTYDTWEECCEHEGIVIEEGAANV